MSLKTLDSIEMQTSYRLKPNTFGNATGGGHDNVPEGQTRIAQRFSVGDVTVTESSPEGTTELSGFRVQFSRPFGTLVSPDAGPNAKALGYSQDVPPGQEPSNYRKALG